MATEPRISLNKLGEYLTASPLRRKRIIQDQQDPKSFITTRYSDARDEIVDFLSNGMIDDEKLFAAAKKLRTEDAPTEYSQQDKSASADAIENFLDTYLKE
jgi:hypothetical protein